MQAPPPPQLATQPRFGTQLNPGAQLGTTVPGLIMQPGTHEPLMQTALGAQLITPQLDPQVSVPKSQTLFGPVHTLPPQATPQVVPPEQACPAGQGPIGQSCWQVPFWQENPEVHAGPVPQ
jgi:hypothetical protein